MIFLDAAAGAPLDPHFLSDFTKTLDSAHAVPGVFFGHATSRHAGGRRVRETLSDAEAALLRTFDLSPTARGGDAYRVEFCASGTEALEKGAALALHALARAGSPVVWSHGVGEHAALRKYRNLDTAFGVPLRKIPKETPKDTEDTASPTLYTDIYGQNETGIVSHIQKQIFLDPHKTHTRFALIDVIASWGKVEIPKLAPHGAALYAVQAGKIGAFPGMAALLYPANLKDYGNVLGGPRSGQLLTAHAIQYFSTRLPEFRAAYGTIVAENRDYLEAQLRKRLPELVFTHDAEPLALRLPHVSHFRVPSDRSLDLVAKLDLRAIAVSSGSACRSQSPEPSDVLLELGWKRIDALNAIRVSLSLRNTRAELDLFVETLTDILETQRS